MPCRPIAPSPTWPMPMRPTNGSSMACASTGMSPSPCWTSVCSARRWSPSSTMRNLRSSAEMRANFAIYVNSLKLQAADGTPLMLQADGRGSLRDHVAALLLASARRALAAGQDVTATPWLRMQGGQVIAVDFSAYARAVGRMKAQPAFDGFALETGENQLFGRQRQRQASLHSLVFAPQPGAGCHGGGRRHGEGHRCDAAIDGPALNGRPTLAHSTRRSGPRHLAGNACAAGGCGAPSWWQCRPGAALGPPARWRLRPR